MKKFMSMLMATVMVLSLVACGQKEEAPAPEGGGAPVSNPVVLKLASSKSSAASQAPCLDWFAEEVEKRTDGAVKVEVYHDSTLGNQDEIVEGLRMGTIEMGFSNCGAWPNVVDNYNILTSLMFTMTEDQFLEFLESDLAQKVCQDVYDETGIYMRGAVLDGSRHVWTSKPLQTVADFKGTMLRVPDVAVYIDSFSALGFNTVVVPWGDCYTALQTGVADGLEMDTVNVSDTSLDEVVKYCMITDHSVSYYTFAMSKAAQEKLTAEQMDIINQCIDEACEMGTKLYRDAGAAIVGEMEAEGVTFFTPSAETLAEMRNIVLPVCQKVMMEKNVDSAYLEELNEYLATL